MRFKDFRLNIAFGVLVAFVLAFGVQGTADALTFTTSRSGDLQTVREDREFTIRFSVSLRSATLRSGYKRTPTRQTDGTAVVITDANRYYKEDGTTGFQGSETTVTYAVAHSYDQEFISIADPSGATIQKINGHTVEAGPYLMYERTHSSYADAPDSQKLSGSITLTLLAGSPEEVSIKITGTTDVGDTAPTTSANFTVYIVAASLTVNADDLTGVSNGSTSADDSDDPQINTSLTGGFVNTHVPMTYKVTGPGRVYIQENGRKSRATATLSTSSAAPVYLDMNGGTNRIEVSTPSVSLKVPDIYIYGRPTLTVTHGSPQTGIVGGRLNDYLAFQVKDAKSRGVSGLAIDFGSEADSAMFTPVAGFLYGSDRMTATPTTAAQATGLDVYTDRNGEVKVYYQLGTSGIQTVTATLTSRFTVTAQFTPTVAEDARKPTLSILSGNNQRTEENGDLEYPLVVVVKRDGHLLPLQLVTFRASKGTLYGSTTLEGGIPVDTKGYAKRVYDRTNARGEASVWYEQDPGEGSDTVRATIGVEDYLDTDLQRRVIFGVNGGQGARPPTPPPDDDDEEEEDDDDDEESVTNIIAVNPTSISGAPGSTQTLLVLSPSTADVTGNTAFTSAGGTVTGSGLTRTVTLPNTAGTNYSLTASASTYPDRTIPITVTGSAPTPPATSQQGTLTAVQEGQQIRVTASPPPPSLLAFTLTRAGVSVGGGEILTTGVGRTIPIGLATGSHILTVSAQGYQSRQVSFTVGTTPPTTGGQPGTGGQPPAATGTAGDPDSIEIDGSRRRSGTLAQALPLQVRVVDANDRGVSGVRVIFEVLAPGQGTFAGARGSGSGIRTETDRNGDASTRFTPTRATSSGTITVEARAAGVTTAQTFIIDVGEGTAPTGASDTAGPQTYQAGTKIPSSEVSLTFTGSRTLNDSTYTCVGPGECVISNGFVTKGQVRVTPVQAVQTKTYKAGTKIPSSEVSLSFTGSHKLNGTTYRCLSDGECVISNGFVTKGEVRVAASTPATTPGTPRTIAPEVLLAAAQRPPMLWVDGGMIYALVGGDVQAFATGVENVQGLAISGNKLYWTAKTGENAGTINSANLDGSGATELVSIKAVPRGIAVDPVAKRLYWTNSQGWIQSSNLEGKERRNVARDLSDPMGIAVAGKSVYWTDDSDPPLGDLGMVGELLNGYSGNNLGTATSLAIFEGKLYWTAKTGENAGTINSVNLGGAGVTELVSIRAVPQGITVDPVAKRLYWTNSQGWIQSSNLQGTARKNVAKGLGSPSSIALSANIKAPATEPATKSTATAGKNKYDINGDGTVDSKDVDVILLAISAGVTTAKYDVNGDKKVDVNDVIAVNANLDAGAAGAPTLLGTQFSTLEVDRLQEQIDLLIATGDRSPAAMKTLIYLQQLIAMARPEKTRLLANYPNPFNPETWMPYELATDTDVRITIYAANGVVVRTLHLGQQSAGYYTDRERAAYWDGKNALGEQVASGIYFYQLETDEMSSLRKMVILK